MPSHLCGSQVAVRISLDGSLSVYADEIKVAEHRLRPVEQGWVTIPAHHQQLWRDTLQVERRELSIYEGVL